MSQLTMMKSEIVDELETLPPESLSELQEFMAFLRFKSAKRPRQEAWRSALATTFGMWADREDIPDDGVQYVQNIRRGHRLNDFSGQIDDETD
jgi:hypothetical protein